jgi:hypothetical protein
MENSGVWKVRVKINRGGESEVKNYIAAASNAVEAVVKIEQMLKARFINYRLLKVESTRIEERRSKAKDRRRWARRETQKKKKAVCNFFFRKTKVRNPYQWVRLNQDLYCQRFEAA